MDNTLLNGSGCIDHTAYDAINNIAKEPKMKKGTRDEAADVLVKNIKDLMWLSGFRLIGRVQFEDPKSGKKYL